MMQQQLDPRLARIVRPGTTEYEPSAPFRPSFLDKGQGFGFPTPRPSMSPTELSSQAVLREYERYRREQATGSQTAYSFLPQQGGVSYQGILTNDPQQSLANRQTLLSRFGGGLRNAADWMQRWVDAPIPGALSLVVSLANRTDVSAGEAVASSLDYLFTGSNELLESELKRLGVKPPKLTGNAIKDRLEVWRTYGDYQIARPDLFWGEKFLGELILSPANLIPFGSVARVTRINVAGDAFTRLGQRMFWSESKVNPLRGTYRAKRGVAERYFQETVARTMDNLDPATGKSLNSFVGNSQADEARRRLMVLYDGSDEAKAIWGGEREWLQSRVQKSHELLHKAFPDRDDFEMFMAEEAPREAIGLLYHTMRAVGQAAVGDRSLRINPIMRFQNKLKVEMSAFTLGLTGRYPLNNAITNTSQLLWRHGARIRETIADREFAEKLGIVSPADLGKISILQSEVTGSLREFGREAGKDAWKPMLARVPILGALSEKSMALAAKSDDWSRQTALSLTARREWSHGWGRDLKDLDLPEDVRRRLSAVVGNDELEATLASLTSGAARSVVPDVTEIGPIAHSYWDEAVREMGRQPESLDEVKILHQKVRETVRNHYREVSDEVRIFGPDIFQSSNTMLDAMIRDIDDLSKRKLDAEVGKAFRMELDALKSEKSTFSQRWLRAGVDIRLARQKALDASEITHIRAYSELEAREQQIAVMGRLRDLRQIRSYYFSLVRIPPEEAASRFPALRKWNAEQRERIFNDYTGRIKTLYDEYTEAISKIPKEQRTGIGLDDLNIPMALPRRTYEEIMREVGLDPKVYSPEQAPDIAQFVRQQGEREIEKLNQALRAASVPPAQVSTAPPAATFPRAPAQAAPLLSQEQIEAVRTTYNARKAQVQRVSIREVEQDFFDYGNRNYIDYLMNHFMPYPFWATRYATYWISRTATNPNQARIMLKAVSEWQKQAEDDPPHLRFSAKIVTLPDGSEVRVSPWGMIFPLAYPFMDILNPGRESHDLNQQIAKVMDFAGGYFYPTAELVGGLAADVLPQLDDVLGTRTGGRGITRTPKDIALNLVPQLGLTLTGLNAFGYNGVTGMIQDASLEDQAKNSIIYAIADDLNMGRLTDQEAAREAIRSIQAGRPNALAAIYARKALGKQFSARLSSLVGVPIRIATPGERVTYAARSRIIPLPGQMPPPPDEIDATLRAFPGLEITQGQTVPSGLNRRQAQSYSAASQYWETVRVFREQREAQLASLWRAYLDEIRENPVSGNEYRKRRQQIWADYMAQVDGALAQTIERVGQAGLSLEDLPLPIAQDASGNWVGRVTDVALGRARRQSFWLKTGRIAYPDNPLRQVEDGYYAINPDLFEDPATGIVDWASFFQTRQAFMDNLEEGEFVYLQSRIYKGDVADKGFRKAQEAVRPYWQARDALMARMPEVEELLNRAERAQKQGKDTLARNLLRNSRIRLFESRLEREREAIRRGSIEVDAALMAFYGFTRPIHRNWRVVAQREYFSA